MCIRLFTYFFNNDPEVRFVFELVIWPIEVTLVSRTQPSGPLCLWQCFHCSRYVWYCPGWRASQYKLFCPENVADLLHLGFIFNFPSDWVENGGNRGDTSKREKRGWRDFPLLENHQTYYSWNHTFIYVVIGLWRAKWTFQNAITGNHQIVVLPLNCFFPLAMSSV